MLLFSPQVSPRLRYVVDFIGLELWEQPLEITTDLLVLANSGEPVINYSSHEFSAPELSSREFQIRPVSLLFETEIRSQDLTCFEMNYHRAFFQTGGDFPFDVFAACFYLLSRYEEYLPGGADEFGRYDHNRSLAFREHFLHQPLINIWLQELRKTLKQKFPGMTFRNSAFQFIPTYDIDIAYAYLQKGWLRSFGGALKSFLRGDWSSLKTRIQVISGKRKDPYDAYEWLDSLHLYCRIKPYYFFLVAANPRGYDRNISPKSIWLQDLIQYHAKGYHLGIHPSWQSGDNPDLLKEEIEWLAYISGQAIRSSRQHYIRMTLPETYRLLIDSGIQRDFSMGYGKINGFRASVASSFYWYDLKKEEATNLELYPFCFMDANAFFEQQISPKDAMQELMQFYRTIKKVNGLMVTIWHNEFLGTQPRFKGWKEVYEVFLKEEVYWD